MHQRSETGRVAVTGLSVEWALHGKEEGEEGSKILACSSGGFLNSAGFEEAIHRYSPGTLGPRYLPSYSLSWLVLEPSRERRVAVAIHDESTQGGRSFIRTRF